MWKDRIGSCFGSQDLIFGSHRRLDLEHAAELLVELVRENVPWKALEDQVRVYLTSKIQEREKTHPSFNPNKANQDIENEIEKMRPFFAPWLAE
jgi:hypothetical protein